MKKILYVHHVSCIGGASYCLLNLIKALDRSIYEPYVLLKDNGPLVDRLKGENVTVFIMGQLCAIPYNQTLLDWRTVSGYFKVYKSRKTFRRFLRSHYFDLVYLNNMMLYPYLKEIRSKSIIHIREHWPLNEHSRQLSVAKKYVKKYAARVVAINHYSASMFSECKDKLDIVYDWVDMSSRRSSNVSFNKIFGEDVTNKKVYLFTGGSNWTKGAKTVVDVFVNEMKGEDKRLLVLGVTSIHDDSFVKNLVKKTLSLLGRRDYLKDFHNLVESDHRIKCIPSVYEITDILVQSYCNLSFFAIPHANLTMAESIIVGTPSVAAKTSESLEYSKNGRLAVLYELGNTEDYIHAIAKMESNYAKLKNKLNNESKDIAEMFCPEKNIAVINKVYSMVLGSE